MKEEADWKDMDPAPDRRSIRIGRGGRQKVQPAGGKNRRRARTFQAIDSNGRSDRLRRRPQGRVYRSGRGRVRPPPRARRGGAGGGVGAALRHQRPATVAPGAPRPMRQLSRMVLSSGALFALGLPHAIGGVLLEVFERPIAVSFSRSSTPQARDQQASQLWRWKARNKAIHRGPITRLPRLGRIVARGGSS